MIEIESGFLIRNGQILPDLLTASPCAGMTAEFLDNLDTIFNDNDLGGSVDGYWARSFLITLLARNCVVHSYPTEDRYYVESFGHMLHAPIAAMLFTWQLAKRGNWV